MIRALICGSFDPVTVGHTDLIRRCAAVFDEVTVCIFSNTEKQYMFSAQERLTLLKEAARPFSNVNTDISDEAVADYVAGHDIRVIVKGARNGTDFDSEYAQARVNYNLCGVETLIFPASPEYSHVSSTVLRNLIQYDKPYDSYLPAGVAALIRKMRSKNI